MLNESRKIPSDTNGRGGELNNMINIKKILQYKLKFEEIFDNAGSNLSNFILTLVFLYGFSPKYLRGLRGRILPEF